MTTTPTLTERARRVSGHLLNASLGDGNPLYTTTIALIRDLLAENAKLRAHAEAMAKVWADDFTEEDMTEAVLNYRADFPGDAQ